jgi:hypothetical protein
MPVGGVEDALRQVMADEAVDAKDEDFFHDERKLKLFLPGLQALHGCDQIFDAGFDASSTRANSAGATG